jgi:hypothetical protein
MSRSKKRILTLTIFYSLFSVLLLFPCVIFAEYKAQAKELFWIDVPEGWTFSEDASIVLLVNPSATEQLYIRFNPAAETGGDPKGSLAGARDEKRREVAERGGKSVMKVERKVDGEVALQTGFLIPSARGLLQATSVFFIHNGRLFDVYFEAPHEFQRLEMEAVLDTLRFQKPEPPKKETPSDEKPRARDVTESIPLPGGESKI